MKKYCILIGTAVGGIIGLIAGIIMDFWIAVIMCIGMWAGLCVGIIVQSIVNKTYPDDYFQRKVPDEEIHGSLFDSDISKEEHVHISGVEEESTDFDEDMVPAAPPELTSEQWNAMDSAQKKLYREQVISYEKALERAERLKKRREAENFREQHPDIQPEPELPPLPKLTRAQWDNMSDDQKRQYQILRKKHTEQAQRMQEQKEQTLKDQARREQEYRAIARGNDSYRKSQSVSRKEKLFHEVDNSDREYEKEIVEEED